MSRVRVYAQCIKRIYPDLVIESAYLNQDGQFNDVLIVNEGLEAGETRIHDQAMVFRFAKYPASLKTLRRETTILKSIRPYISLAIPNPIYHNLDTQVIGEAFVGYPMIAGKPLWRDLFETIDDPVVLDRIAGQLATFLRELHGISVADVIPIDLPLDDDPAAYADMYARIRDKLFVYMRPDARAQVADHFESYLGDPDLYTFEPVLRHGDFGTGNLIYDPDEQRIAGVIDFGFAGLGDAATDLAGLRSGFGAAFLERCARTYPEIDAASRRIEFYYGTFALQEALFGIENGDRKAFQAGIESFV